MRLLEIILFIFAITYTILFYVGYFKRINRVRYTSLTSIIFFLLHRITEGTRWQMYPIYFIILFISIVAFLSNIDFQVFEKIYARKVLRICTAILLIILISLSTVASYMFPLYNLIKPSGPYKIGTISFDAVDMERIWLDSENNYGGRKIRIQLWYPTDKVEDYELSPWLEEGAEVADSISRLVGFPEFLLRPITMIKSNSYKGAPLSLGRDRYPLIIISHGLTGLRSLHTDLAEMLASNGYIVAAIDHTNVAAVTVFDDGEAVYLNSNVLSLGANREEFLSDGNKILNVYAEDILFTIETLRKFNVDEGAMFKGKLDLSAIGLIGHSAGGGAGVLAAGKDSSIKAIVGFDPWLEPIKSETINKGLYIPALFLRSQQWKTDPNSKNLFPLLESSKSFRQLYQINGTTHLDFTMIYMYSPLSKPYGYSGQLDGNKSSLIRQEFVLNFFNKYLIEEGTFIDLEDVMNKYPEVEKVDYNARESS
jgi:dienelactone hydrolase